MEDFSNFESNFSEPNFSPKFDEPKKFPVSAENFSPVSNAAAAAVTEPTVGFEPLPFTKPWNELRIDPDTPVPIITGTPEKLTEPSGKEIFRYRSIDI